MFKIIVGVLLLYTLYVHISAKELSGYTWTEIFDESRLPYLLMCVLLMPVNWWMETKKWMCLMPNTIPMRRAIIGVLQGVTLGLITPARVGEYGGRAMIFDDVRGRVEASWAVFVGSIWQNIMNVGLGFISLCILVRRYGFLSFEQLEVLLISLLGLVLGIGMVGWQRRRIWRWLQRWIPERYRSMSLKSFRRSDLMSAALWAFLRYAVYVSQYLLISWVFGFSDEVVSSVLIISTIYFFQSMLPLPAILALLARGEIALIAWGLVTDDTIGILGATFFLWVINLVIPALLGYILILSRR